MVGPEPTMTYQIINSAAWPPLGTTGNRQGVGRVSLLVLGQAILIMALTADEFPSLAWPRGPRNELHLATRAGSIERTVALLSDGSVDIDQGTPEGYTPLMLTTANGHVHIVRILLNKRGQCVNSS